MSTIAVDNARPSAGGTAYSLTDGVAKAWALVQVTGGSPAILDDLNGSSMTDNGVGEYSLNYTNSFASSPACQISTGQGSGAASQMIRTYGTGLVRWVSYDSAGTAVDYELHVPTSWGDLA